MRLPGTPGAAVPERRSFEFGVEAGYALRVQGLQTTDLEFRSVTFWLRVLLSEFMVRRWTASDSRMRQEDDGD